MSKPMKVITGLAGVLVLAAVVMSMLGKLELPIGPLNGMLAGEEEVVAAGPDPNAALNAAGTTDPDCLEETPLAGTEPSAGVPDPAASADPAAADPAAGGTDPNAAAPVASGAADTGRLLVADVGDGTGVDPALGTDPAATDPAATDPAAADPAATDPAAADPAADPNFVDPCADQNAAAGATDDPAAAAGGGSADPAAAGAGTPPAATDPKAKPITTDGTNNGNSPEALTAAKDASSVMEKAQIQVTTTASLVPSAGGVGKGAALRRYRNQVQGATLVIKLGDSALPQWTEAGKKVQRNLVSSFLTRLGTRYKQAARSVTVLDSSGNVLAIGDAASGAKGSVKLF